VERVRRRLPSAVICDIVDPVRNLRPKETSIMHTTRQRPAGTPRITRVYDALNASFDVRWGELSDSIPIEDQAVTVVSSVTAISWIGRDADWDAFTYMRQHDHLDFTLAVPVATNVFPYVTYFLANQDGAVHFADDMADEGRF